MNVNRLHTDPLSVPRTRRNQAVAVLTSLPAGKMVPITAFPLLREDGMNGALSVIVEMMETHEILMNPVNLRVMAYVVPWLAFPRFEGSRDQFDRSYMGEPKVDGGAVVPFVDNTALATDAGAVEIYKYLGLHAKSGTTINAAYRDAYNLIWNMRAKNRSLEIVQRLMSNTALAPAFWQHSRFAHVVPDFDQAVIDGEVALNVVESRLNVTGLGFKSGNTPAPSTTLGVGVRESTGVGANYTTPSAINVGSSDQVWMRLKDIGGSAWPDIAAELQADAITVSLSNIELAKKTQAFAKLRERFEGHDDEYIIDMLMSGLTIPDQNLKQPILIADQTVRFAQAKRYATDAANLAESAVSGVAQANLRLRIPRINTGGVVMVVAEAVPEQLFERQQDPYWVADTVDDFPEYVRDTLDPEKVDIVKNGDIDADHATPGATFGYAPMNWKWNAAGPRVGGKFYKSAGVPGSETVRQRLWAVENLNPVLSEDFYIVKSMHIKPFLDTASDPFECTAMGNCVIDGNTVFGGVLVESTTNYDKVADKAPTDRIVKA